MAQSNRNRDASVGASTADVPQGSYTAQQLFFLQRLVWLQKQRRECTNVLAPNDWQMRLIHKALYSTYRDCVEAGVQESAKQVLNKEELTTN